MKTFCFIHSIEFNSLCPSLHLLNFLNITGSLHSLVDKEEAFQQFVNQSTSPKKVENGSDGMSVYIGDSITDLLGALNAHVGIMAFVKPRTEQFCKDCGIELTDLDASVWSSGDVQNVLQHRRNNLQLFKANSWTQIRDFFFE